MIKRCPFCGSKNIVEIIYGYPSFETVEAEKAGKIHLGGCCIVCGIMENRYCNDCNKKFTIDVPEDLLSEISKE